MDGDVDILHHVGLVTSTFGATIERYERLGFAFTPLSMPAIPLRPGGPPEPLGAGNRTAIFEHNYLEILGIFDRERWDSISVAQRGPYDLDRPLSRYEGLHVMHFGADDLEVVRARLARDGVPCSESRPFQRPVDTPDGPRTMRAKALHFPPGANPEALIQIAQHVTPELVLQPRFMRHANGATALTEIIVCAPDPAGLSATYARYTGHASAAAGNFQVLELGRSRVILVAPEHLGEVVPDCVPPTLPFLAGFTVTTADLGAARRWLIAADVPFREHAGRLAVPPDAGCGSAVLFEREGASR
jgi:hypothetical protein